MTPASAATINWPNLRPLAAAIAEHENGEQPYLPDVPAEGARMAGVA